MASYQYLLMIAIFILQHFDIIIFLRVMAWNTFTLQISLDF